MKSNLNKVLLIVVIVLLVVLVALLVKQYLGGGPSYYAVYLKTGDLYFGELSTFPSFALRHVYMLQVNAQNQQNPISIQRFANVFWGPEDYLKINKDEVVWYTKLSPDGQLAKLIKNNPNLTPTSQLPPQVPPSVSTSTQNLQGVPSSNQQPNQERK